MTKPVTMVDLDAQGEAPIPSVQAPVVDMVERDGMEPLLTSSTPEARLRLLQEEAEKLGMTVVDPTNQAAEEQRKDREHQAALRGGRASTDSPSSRSESAYLDRVVLSVDETDQGDEEIFFHFVEDGLTALNNMWHKGQELKFIIQKDAAGTVVGSPAYVATLDRNGDSWVHIYDDPSEQIRRFGKILMVPGPWGGEPWPEDEVGQRERERAARPPVPSDDSFMRGVPRRR